MQEADSEFNSVQKNLALRKELVDYYSDFLDEEVTRVVKEKGYTQKDFDDMLNGDS